MDEKELEKAYREAAEDLSREKEAQEWAPLDIEDWEELDEPMFRIGGYSRGEYSRGRTGGL